MRNIDWFPLSRQAGTRHCLQLGVVMKRKFSSSENSRPSPHLSNVLINSWPFPGLENSISNSRTFPEFPTAWQPWCMLWGKIFKRKCCVRARLRKCQIVLEKGLVPNRQQTLLSTMMTWNFVCITVPKTSVKTTSTIEFGMLDVILCLSRNSLYVLFINGTHYNTLSLPLVKLAVVSGLIIYLPMYFRVSVTATGMIAPVPVK